MQQRTVEICKPIRHINRVANAYDLTISGEVEIEEWHDIHYDHDVISYDISFECDPTGGITIERHQDQPFAPYCFQQRVETHIRAYLGHL